MNRIPTPALFLVRDDLIDHDGHVYRLAHVDIVPDEITPVMQIVGRRTDDDRHYSFTYRQDDHAVRIGGN